ncbi:MAG: glutamate-5-semialdehyde dehydrogenase [Clostridia bacterium]|nr:glutamate-5-semialdehyde dehydrogenase [Clostridia bacterium]
MELKQYVEELCASAKRASATFAALSTAKKNAILSDIADKLISGAKDIVKANLTDLENAETNGVRKTMIDRLRLDEARIKGISDSLREVAALPDPVGKGERWVRPNGLEISRVRAPLGTVAIIYEARPNVTVDAAALCIKTGNTVILRGGKEAIATNRMLAGIMREVIKAHGQDANAVCLLDDTSREGTVMLMSMRQYVDVLIPRGSKGLIRSVVENAKIPVIETGAGNCHIYIDSSADMEMALDIAVNAKMQRPSVCNAVETMLVHRDIAKEFLPMFYERTRDRSLEIRGDSEVSAILPDSSHADESDWETEYNDYILAVKIVGSVEEAVDHINKYNTGHSEAIVTNNIANAGYFQTRVDAAAVYVNASTRFTDGGEFGFGAEIGISTQKLHARGPMALRELTTDKYLINGQGQIRK